ncbi:MAG: hypothetical protein JWN52_2487 [Actinomycetia bacterium]|nr:hypothetical protein [Actinomycetes bacterium]
MAARIALRHTRPDLRRLGGRMRADTAPSEQKRLYELDLLRFLSAMFVVSYHYAGVNSGFWTQGARHLFPELAPVARFGHLGVLLFFMISGFVILMSGWGRQIGDFAVSRITRLFPAYWASVALTVVIFYTAGTFFANASGPDSVPRRLLPNLTMLEGGVGADYMEGLYWTLWTELHFYVLIAILIYCGVTYSRSVGFMVTWLLLSVFAMECKVMAVQMLLLSAQAPYFIAGMAFYLMYRYRPNLVLWMIVGACWALSCYYLLRGVDPNDAWPGVYKYAVPATLTTFYILMALVATGRLAWMRWRRLTLLGALTYPLYLTHETVARPVVKFLYPTLNRGAVLGLCVALALLTAYVIHRCVERPGSTWMRTRLKQALKEIRAGDATPPRPVKTEPAPELVSDLEVPRTPTLAGS